MFGFNKYIIYGIIIATSISIFATFVLMWRSSIKQQALLEANNKQLTQVVEDQQKFIKQMNDVFTLQQVTIDELSKKNDQLSVQLSGIEAYLNSDKSVKDNRPSSELLKETIRRLGNTK